MLCSVAGIFNSKFVVSFSYFYIDAFSPFSRLQMMNSSVGYINVNHDDNVLVCFSGLLPTPSTPNQLIPAS